MSYYSSAGMKKRGRSMSSSMETQYPCPDSKKPRLVDYRKSFSSSPGKAACEVIMGSSVSDGGKKKGDVIGDRFSTDSKATRVERLKKRFGRIIAKATEFEVDRRSDMHNKKVDSMEMQRKKNQILEKKLKEAEVVAEDELKMELQRKREAAKKALEELERSVEVDDYAITMKDFTVMLGYPRNCAVYLCNEIGWYGAPVMVCSRRSTS